MAAKKGISFSPFSLLSLFPFTLPPFFSHDSLRTENGSIKFMEQSSRTKFYVAKHQTRASQAQTQKRAMHERLFL
jgi:hypothetical protein